MHSKTNFPFPRRNLKGGWKFIVCPRCYSVEQIQLLEHLKSDPLEFAETFISQYKGEPRRKMVSNALVDIVFWFGEDDSITGFQYSFYNEGELHAFTWHRQKRSRFHRVVTDRRRLRTNTLVANGVFPRKLAEKQFLDGSTNLRADYREIVVQGIRAHIDEWCVEPNEGDYT